MSVMAVQADTAQFRFGTQSLKVTTGSTGNNAIYPGTGIPVTPGQQYTFSAYLKTNAPITGGYLALRLAPAGSLTQFAESIAVTDTSASTDNGWQRVILTATIPDGVFSIRPIVVYTGTTAGQVFWLDGVKHEPGAVASVWQENLVSGQATHDPIGSMIDASAGGVWRLIGSAGGSRDTVQLGTHGLQFAGDTEVYSPAAGDMRMDGPAAVDARWLVNAVTGKIARILLGVAATFDVRLSRTAAKTLTVDDGAGGVLTLVDLLGAPVNGKTPTTHIYTAAGASTWTKPAGLVAVRVRCVGGGGGGGGSPAVATIGQHSEGGGGASGGYAEAIIAAASLGATVTVTVGAGGGGGAGAAGGSTGGDSSFGALCIAKGGGGGSQGVATSIFISEAGGSGIVTGSFGDTTVAGSPGAFGMGSAGRCSSGNGGSSAFGGGALGIRIGGDTASGAGNAGTSGGGGSGAAQSGSTNASKTGGAGGDGLVIVEEFYGP